MRKLPLLLALLLVAVASAAPAAPASPPPLADQTQPFVFDEEDEAEEAEEESDECVIEDEEDVQLCAEIAAEEKEMEADECVVEDATAKLTPKPGADSFALAVRYRASSPTAVVIDARLRGGKGSVRLGVSRTRFRRAGTFRDSFSLSEKEMERALAAREFQVEVRAVNSPRYCSIDLSGGLRLAKR